MTGASVEGGCRQPPWGSSWTVMRREGALIAASHQLSRGCSCFVLRTSGLLPCVLPCWMYVLATANAFAQGGFSLCGQHISCLEELCVPPAAHNALCIHLLVEVRRHRNTHIFLQMRERGKEEQDGCADDDAPSFSLQVV